MDTIYIVLIVLGLVLFLIVAYYLYKKMKYANHERKYSDMNPRGGDYTLMDDKQTLIRTDTRGLARSDVDQDWLEEMRRENDD